MTLSWNPNLNTRLPLEISLLRQWDRKANATTLNLGLGRPSVDMPPELRSLAQDVIATSSLGYTPNAGLPELREQMSLAYGLTPDSFVITSGAQEGLICALLALINPGDDILIPNPGFLAYKPMIEMLQGKACFYEMELQDHAFHYNIEAIKNKVTPKTKAILICSPSNPCGTDISPQGLQDLARYAIERNITLICDEVYGELAYHTPYIPAATIAENIVTVSSFSKPYALTGWRIGWLATSNPRLHNAFLVAHQYLVTCANTPAQHLVLKLFQTVGLRQKIQHSFLDLYHQKFTLFDQHAGPELKEVIRLPAGGFYLFLPIPTSFQTSAEFCEDVLKSHNLLLIPGQAFGSLGQKFVRLSFSAPDQDIQKAAEILNFYYL
jgi:aspartate/methionine/tyrosine aminotransferase